MSQAKVCDSNSATPVVVLAHGWTADDFCAWSAANNIEIQI